MPTETSTYSSDPRYPIGTLTFTLPAEVTPELIAQWIDEIAALPIEMRSAVSGLSDTQLDTSYREGGWTIRQVVHHVPDSHLNGYTRCKLALTEDTPTIKPYEEARWAELHDTFETPIEVSLSLLDALHVRWGVLLRGLDEPDLQRGVFHPERNRVLSLAELIEMYAWHGRHHVAHIKSLRRRKGWGSVVP